MVIFFFTVGLEIRREISHGQLSTPKKAVLPIIAAIGGMAVPACIFMCFNAGTATTNGWGIPTATDIAFAIGIMSLLGNRVPISLKVFLTALAVADDLGAILVIAIFYGETPNLMLLGIAIAIMVGIYVMRRLGEFRMMAYLVPAVVVWILFYYSGVHATISGVAMAMLIPTKPRYSRSYYLHKADIIEKGIVDADKIENDHEAEESRLYYLRRMKQISDGASGMSHRMEHLLMPYVNFLIMPKQVANYFIANCSDDWLPRVDFRAPAEPVYYDSTAGMITACGLIELGKLLPENEGGMYTNAAIKLLKAMTEKFVNFDESTDDLVGYGSQRYPIPGKFTEAQAGVHISIIYGDYFYAEALLKLLGSEFNPWMK